MLCVSNMFGVVVSAILLSTVTDLTHGLYVPHAELQRAVVHKKFIATWDEAKLRCEKEGAMLASPVDSGLLEYMKFSIGVNNHTTPYFIGMRLIDNPEHTAIVSVEGIPLDDLPQAALDMIEQIDPQDGDCLIMDGHDIRTGPCHSRLPYICYKNCTTDTTTTSTTTPTTASTTTYTTTSTTAPTTTSTTTPTTTSTITSVTQVTTETTTEVTTEVTTTETPDNCTAGGYTKLLTGYYKLHTSKYAWELADKTCRSEDGYLVVLNNEEEARIITDFAFPAADEPWVLVGITVQDEGWHSVLGEPMDQLYNKWTDNHNPEETYTRAALHWDGLLGDMDWGYKYPFVCERLCVRFN